MLLHCQVIAFLMKDYKDNLSLEHHVQMKHSQQSSDGNIQH